MEDEIHFVLSCSLYKNERKKMLDHIFQKFPNTVSLNDENMFTWLMSQEEKNVTTNLG